MAEGLLLDTHIWLWYLAGSERLGASIRDRISEAPERCWLSPISVWEAGLLQQRGRLELNSPFSTWLARARGAFPLKEAALTTAVAEASLSLELPHRDPADRFLAATAVVYELTLVTADARLIESPGVPTG
ncbi:MAG TPA: type II toxin-antitoxin system VapC family toxin [Actinomycetota bacterium]|nr:type II toxin-antitoxin system VapC family toxin [Actinomycetota bacterium]